MNKTKPSDDLINAAQAASENGMKSLMRFCDGLNNIQKSLLRDNMSFYRNVACDVDDERDQEKNGVKTRMAEDYLGS